LYQHSEKKPFLEGVLKSPDSRQIVEYLITPASGQLG
jgi:hypothetical protein